MCKKIQWIILKIWTNYWNLWKAKKKNMKNQDKELKKSAPLWIILIWMIVFSDTFWLIVVINLWCASTTRYILHTYIFKLCVGLGLVTDRVPEIGFSGTQNQPKNGFKGSWKRLFFILLKARSTLKNHQICQNLAKKNKNWKKPCLTCH